MLKGWQERRRRARLMRENRHYHPQWDRPGGAFTHSHLFPTIDHQHELPTVCRREGCQPFPIHRVHPRSVVQ